MCTLCQDGEVRGVRDQGNARKNLFYSALAGRSHRMPYGTCIHSRRGVEGTIGGGRSGQTPGLSLPSNPPPPPFFQNILGGGGVVYTVCSGYRFIGTWRLTLGDPPNQEPLATTLAAAVAASPLASPAAPSPFGFTPSPVPCCLRPRGWGKLACAGGGHGCRLKEGGGGLGNGHL